MTLEDLTAAQTSHADSRVPDHGYGLNFAFDWKPGGHFTERTYAEFIHDLRRGDYTNLFFRDQ